MSSEPRGTGLQAGGAALKRARREGGQVWAHSAVLTCVDLLLPGSVCAFPILELTKPIAFPIDLDHKPSCSFLPLSLNVL